MKRFHVHVVVDDLTKSIPFYSAVFAQEPTVRKPDYAKWLLDDPRLNFAISNRNVPKGINHLGFQAEDEEEFGELHARLRQAGHEIVSEQDANCCYARSDKHWVVDPQGIAWETFRSLGEIPLYAGEGAPSGACGTPKRNSGCCPSNTTTSELVAAPHEHAAGCCPAV